MGCISKLHTSSFKTICRPSTRQCLWGDSHHSWFGPKPAWWPSFVPFSPALLILPFPAGFRLTCYYYRGAYYKVFGPIRRRVQLVNRVPDTWASDIFRWLFRTSIATFFTLQWCSWSFSPTTRTWDSGSITTMTERFTNFGIGVGTIVLCVNVFLLRSYTLGCHSLRHLDRRSVE